MKTYILKESEVENYYQNVLAKSQSISEAIMKIAVIGMQEYDIEDAKRTAEIGDCMLFSYDNKMVPFQVIHKNISKDENGNEIVNCVMQPYYLLEKHRFDPKTNVWRDSEIRRYINGDFLKKFDPELVSMMKETEVHTDDYVTKDKMWLLSHEEIGYEDTDGMFKKNIGAKTYDYYKQAIAA